MNKIKEINLFTNGDSNEIHVFSNVPYFFAQTLESKGIKINRINIKESKVLSTLFKLSISLILKVIDRKSNYTYFRSFMHHKHARSQIKKALKQYPNADINLFMTFSFSASRLSNKPTILFGDWTYMYYFEYFTDKKPNFLERKTIERENENIEHADLTFALFPSITDYMKNTYNNKHIYYLGNVINAFEKPIEASILPLKLKSDKLLFIGKKGYKEGATSLIESFSDLKQTYPTLTLDIIGMNESEFENIPDGVFCHGYLDKGNEKERELFYNLLKGAKAFVNTTPKWGAFSASLEAMYYYTPLIVSPYKEFKETFGENIDFGFFCESNSSDILTQYINQLLSLDDQDYQSLCMEAHNKSKDFTWNNYIEKFLEKVNEIITNKEN